MILCHGDLIPWFFYAIFSFREGKHYIRGFILGRVFVTMKKISSYLMEHKLGYFIAIGAMVISVSLDMLSPQITRHIIDDVIIGGQMNKFIYLLAGIALVGLGRCIFQYIKEYTFDKIGSKIASEMRVNVFRHIQGLSADFFDRNNTGELMSRVKDDIDRIWEALTFVVMLIIEVVIHTGIILFCMFQLNVKLTIIPTIAMIFSACIAVIMERKLGPVYGEISEENAVLNTVAEENLAGVRTVKAFAREKHEITKFLSHNKRYYDLNMKQSNVFIKYYPYFQIITRLLPLSVVLLGGQYVMEGDMTLGTLTAFVEYSGNIVWPMEMLGWLSNSISSAIASNKKLKAIYKEKPSILEIEKPIAPDKIEGTIEFSHVSFKKGDSHDILSDINFKVDAGKTIGIMGTTGAGKTSIIHLLQRLYDTTEGTIYVDGIDIKNLKLCQLRGSISLVMQDVFLFSDTIAENVKLGKRELVDQNTIRMASEKAQASDFIERMDKQYETIIGERGVGLSGGQKQRISIARALAKKNPILVMDDSTSALDMETEHQIQQTLNELDHTTKIIIAHRISAVRKADEIIVLDEGMIKERGTHEELLRAGGLYYETYLAQYGDYQIKKEA